MSKVGMVMITALILLLGGGIWLYFRDIPAPSQKVEQELSDEGIRR